MPDGILSFIDGSFLWILLIGLALYFTFKMVTGFFTYRKIMGSLSAEGILIYQRWVLVRMKFPLIWRITFSHVYLTKRRFILFHFLTRGLTLQVPLGPQGKPGKDEGYFEVEKSKGRKILVFRTGMRGGGRIRLHLEDAEAWYREIRDN